MPSQRFSAPPPFVLLSLTALAALCLLAPGRALTAAPREKMKPEEVVLKHLQAIGEAETRASVTSRVVVGTCKFSYRARGIGQSEGRVVLASEGPKSLIGMEFLERDYPFERLGFDGRTFTAGYIRPGVRTVLGDFLYTNSGLLREGLLGGTLTQAWPLLNMEARNAKIEYDGTRKVAGREAHVLNYLPRKGSDLQIELFFDAATFQHVRSEYQQVVGALQGSTDQNSAGQRSSSYKIVEEFSDYKKESGLMLPHSYKLQFMINDRAGASQFEWVMNLSQYAFNKRIPPESFNVEAYKPGE